MSGSEPGAARVAPDLRLLPLAAGMWAAELVVLLLQPAHRAPVAVVGGAVMAASLAAGRWLPRRVLLLAAGFGLGLAVGATHVARVHPGLVESAVRQGAVVTATVRITGDPRATTRGDDGGRREQATWYVPARATAIEFRGAGARLRVPVLIEGAAARDLVHGELVRVSARARSPWDAASQGAALALVSQPRVLSPPGAVARATGRIRQALRSATAGLPPDAGALLLGLSVGDESTLPVDLDAAMVRSGLAHLTAVSGSNTSLVMGLALAAATMAGLGWRGRATSSAAVLAGYVALVRPQPSVLRAAAMGAVALLALTAGGRRRGPPALLAAVLVLLVAVPSLAVSMGFALSVAATAGLLLLGPGLVGGLARWPWSRWVPGPVREAVAVAAAAHLATTPLAVMMGNGASLVALPANVLVTPAVAPATVIGLAAALVAPVAPGPAALLARVAAPFTGFIAVVARRAAAVPMGVLAVPGGAWSGVVTVALLGVTALAVRAWRRGWRPRSTPVPVVLAASAALAVLLVVGPVRDGRWPPAGWLVLACDVGQGDGLLLRAPGARLGLLVDAGPADGHAAACVRDAGMTGLVVLVTHFHADHVDGLSEVLDDVPVSAVLTTWVEEPVEGARWVRSVADRHGVAVHSLRAGQRATVAGIGLEVIWPARALPDSPANNGSLVTLAHVPAGVGELRVLLAGDVEPEAQAAILAAGAAHAGGAGSGPVGALGIADVVKVPHHGSRHQVPGFARWAGARIALVCVGRDNDYGHPSAATLAQYRGLGADVGRTDEDGALAVVPGPQGPRLRRQR